MMVKLKKKLSECLIYIYDASQPDISEHGRCLYNYSVGYRKNCVVMQEFVWSVNLEKHEFSGPVHL